jgi:predicted membrane chloride channel (bestrophin family)
MKKYRFLFSIHTIIIACISLISSYISIQFELTLFADFLIVGVILAFPISFAMREAFRRRERAIAYLSLFKGSLQSVFYCFENSKLDQERKKQVKNIFSNISSGLMQYLKGKPEDACTVDQHSEQFFSFIRDNEENLKSSFSVKIMLFFFRVTESIEFLLATKRHRTPIGIRLIVLFSFYLFAVLYPASLLHRIGFQVSLWYVFVTTYFKAFLFICLYNIQYSLEDPFKEDGVDSIRLRDFEFPLPDEKVTAYISAGSLKVADKISTEVPVSPDALNQG